MITSTFFTARPLYNLAAGLMAVSFLASNAFAEEQENLYQIEFILFKQAAPDLSVLEFEKATEQSSDSGAFLTIFPNLGAPLSPYQRTGLGETAELTLVDQVERLNKKGFTVLSQGAWQEQLENDSQSLPVRLSSEARPFDCEFWRWICPSPHPENDDLEVENQGVAAQQEFLGQLVIRRSRYMHAELHIDYYFKRPVLYGTLLEYIEDSDYARPPMSALLVPSTDTGDGEALYANHATRMISVKSFSFEQSRRVKNNEIHYLDHPYLGMIVSIKRIEPSEYP